jgi:hypothetical protein
MTCLVWRIEELITAWNWVLESLTGKVVNMLHDKSREVAFGNEAYNIKVNMKSVVWLFKQSVVVMLVLKHC